MKPVAILLILVLPVFARAQFIFTTNADGSLNVSEYTGLGGDVVIPGATNGLVVTSIGTDAFASFPYTIGVTIPNSVLGIGDHAFLACPGLTNIVIGDSVATIGEYAFTDCGTLTNIFLPNSVTNIGLYALSGLDHMTNISVGLENACYSSSNGVLFDKPQTTLIQFPTGGNGSRSYTVLGTVTNIGIDAFQFCAALMSVTIPNSVTAIQKDAFDFCGLTNIVFGTNLTTIGVDAFVECPLTAVTLPDSVVSIGDDAFDACHSLTNILLGANVASMGSAVFEGCSRLLAIEVSTNNPNFAGVGGVLFNKAQTTLLGYPGGVSGSYTIPAGVTSIADEAFANCGLTSVTIPNGVTSIGYEEFLDSGALVNVIIPYSVTNIVSDAFGLCGNLTGVYFGGNAPLSPNDTSVFADSANVTVYYLPGTTNWGATLDGVPTALWFQSQPEVLSFEPTFGVQNDEFGFTISWATNATLIVQACTNLSAPVWVPVSTNTLAEGTSYFSDPQWTQFPSRYYELAFP